jgi:hypothetical protein
MNLWAPPEAQGRAQAMVVTILKLIMIELIGNIHQVCAVHGTGHSLHLTISAPWFNQVVWVDGSIPDLCLNNFSFTIHCIITTTETC